MRRREFIWMVGGAATWPLAVWAQQTNAQRRIAILMILGKDDPEANARITAFQKGLQEAGWIEGRNIHFETRWSAGNETEIRRHAEELIALAPDVILANGNAAVAPLLTATRSIPIVFAIVPDPVGAGFVESLARPGGNATGFVAFEYGLGAKWLEILKEIAPNVTRAAVLRDPSLASGKGQFDAIQSASSLLGLELSPIGVRDAVEMEHAIAEFARFKNGGLIVTSNPLVATHRDLIVMLAAKHKLPAVYFARHFTGAGGLISYGPDYVDQFRRAASYAVRILKGEKPSDLPVQAPTKYELIVNLKTAKALGIQLPLTLAARADQVIEQ
jgi:putative tryptophan/tyrosine transport system substrate-binding protein